MKARISVVRARMTAFEAFREICIACLAHLEANRSGMLAGEDPEYLHQMRVALRRLRSAFSVFSRVLPEPASRAPLAEIRWLAGALGPARDRDVFMTETMGPVAEKLPGHRSLAVLRRALEARRAQAQRAARRAVASARFRRLLRTLKAWLAGTSPEQVPSKPLGEFARAALARRYRRVRKRGRGLARLDAARLHRLRIAVKKLRYAAQFFAPLFPPRRAAPMREALEALQDSLGGINDCSVARRFLREVDGQVRGVCSREALGLLACRNQAELARHRCRLKAAWKKFRAAEPYWED